LANIIDYTCWRQVDKLQYLFHQPELNQHCENYIALRKLVAGILRGAAGAAHSSPQELRKRANSLYRSNQQL